MLLDHERMEAIVRAESTVSGKIRALDRAGFRRADIARFLNRRYQHVRNVLEAEKQRSIRSSEAERAISTSVSHHKDPEQPPALCSRTERTASQAGPAVPTIHRLSTSEDGSLLIPASVLRAVGIGGGEIVVGTVEGGQVALVSATASMRRAQELMARLLPGDDSLAESLMADRRREVEQQRTDG